MRVYLGNTSPHELRGDDTQPLDGPAVTTFNLRLAQEYPDDRSADTFDPNQDTGDIALHLLRVAQSNSRVTHLPENSAVLHFLHPTDSALKRHTDGAVAWVHAQADGEGTPELAQSFEGFLAKLLGCETGLPGDVEDTHYTDAGPPGIGGVSSPHPLSLTHTEA